MKKLRFGLIGCGKIARRHAEIIKSLENAELVSVCDAIKERAQWLGGQNKVNWYVSFEEMLEKERLDIVNILTPSGTHAQIALNIAGKVNNLIVEKPMALTLQDTDSLIKACDKFKTRLFVVQQNRFNVPVVKLQEAVKEGRFGKLVLGTIRVRWTRTQEYYNRDSWRGTRAMDGGVLLNQANHHIDLLTWMMGDIDSVMSMGATRLANIETEDTAVAILKFKNGALGVIEATTATRPKDLEGSISILGERGSVEIGGYAANEMKIWNFSDYSKEDESIFKKHGRNPENIHGFAHREYIKNVINRIREEEYSLTDGFMARKSLELINAMHESALIKGEVSLRH